MDKRAEYMESLYSKMVEWDLQIDLLRKRSSDATDWEKYEYSNAIEGLNLKKDEARLKLQRMYSATDEEVDDLMTGTEQMLGEIRTLLRDAITKIE